MSERGLVLALQRLHDDPGFVDLVTQDPQNTLGIYDLEDAEYQQLVQAVVHRNPEAISSLAEQTGIDWNARHIEGLGTITGDEDTSGGSMGIKKPNALTGDGYDGVMPKRSAGA